MVDGIAASTLVLSAIVWLWPIISRVSTVLPGTGPGDNLTFVWNVWWVRYVLTHPAVSLFYTPLLFYPFGADLTLHTSTLLPAIAVSGIADPVTAQNVLIVLHVFLNSVCAYALARYETRDWRAALLAGWIFSCSPFVLGHLDGHFNLIAAWILPFAALLAVRTIQRPTAAWSAGLGIVLGASAYVDYYLFVYAFVLVTALFVPFALTITRQPAAVLSPGRLILIRAVLLLLAADFGALLWVVVGGGGIVTVLGSRISIRGTATQISIAWILGLIAVWLAFAKRLRVRTRLSNLRPRVSSALMASGAMAITISPLIWNAGRLLHVGDYTTQRYFWRSAPPGIDLASFVLGNPFNLLYGGLATKGYARLGINTMESLAWMAPAVLILAIVGARASRTTEHGQRWLLPLILFLAWAMGPYIYVADRTTTMWMPAVLLRWVPIVNNARIPGRAIVVVYLAVAMLAAEGFAALWRKRRSGLAFALAGMALLDLAPRRPALYTIERPRLYETLKGQPPGAVCELPIGLRDGFGEIGRFDERTLVFQTIHEHALVGGFEARLPVSLKAHYSELPVIADLLRLSGDAPPPIARPSRDEARRVLRNLNIRYVVVNRATSPPGLLQYVSEVLPLEPLATEGERTLFLVR